jgi:hypothetical protein|tara:strand:- start:218 stop:502 length:285 start_codon:yes stop_codon:yes gene_type:complete
MIKVPFLNKLILKIASEVHKSRIEKLEIRILDMEQDKKVTDSRLNDCSDLLSKLEDRLYNANLDSSKAVGAINALLQTGKINSLNEKRNEDVRK